MVREKEFLGELIAQGPDTTLAELNAEALSFGKTSEQAGVMTVLRMAKRRVALAIALADIAGVYDLAAVTGALTRFADAAVKGALRFLLVRAAKNTELAQATPEQLEASTGLIVLAMGKHGAFELNYSSDIDFVVFYRADSFPFGRDGDRRVAAISIARGLVRLLTETTPDGYVFRVDLRLRPDAGATQIAISTDAAELLRKHGPELGARGHDQGAGLRRRSGSAAERSCRC